MLVNQNNITFTGVGLTEKKFLRGDVFRKILSLNEQIKKIDRYAYIIRLRAINALILSAKFGTVAAAFGVVTSDLIRFSEEIRHNVGELNETILSVVFNTTELAKIRNTERLLDRAVQNVRNAQRHRVGKQNSALEAGSALITKSWDSNLENRRAQLTGIREMVEVLIQRTNVSLKLCMAARVAVLGGKIETAYIESGFTSVIVEIEETIDLTEIQLKLILQDWM